MFIFSRAVSAPFQNISECINPVNPFCHPLPFTQPRPGPPPSPVLFQHNQECEALLAEMSFDWIDLANSSATWKSAITLGTEVAIDLVGICLNIWWVFALTNR